MKKIIPVHSYDYNEEGYVPNSCDNCGLCDDAKKIIVPHTITANFSNSFKKFITDEICCGGANFDWRFKKDLDKELKDIKFDSPYTLTEEIISRAKRNGFLLDFDFVLNTIYYYLSSNSFDI